MLVIAMLVIARRSVYTYCKRIAQELAGGPLGMRRRAPVTWTGAPGRFRPPPGRHPADVAEDRRTRASQAAALTHAARSHALLLSTRAPMRQEIGDGTARYQAPILDEALFAAGKLGY